jgi:CBS domain-containing protein
MVREIAAKDIMESEVVTLKSDTSLSDASGLFKENRISGAPVIDSNGHIVGVVSQSDVLKEMIEIDLDDYLDNSFYMCLPFSDGSVFSTSAHQPDLIPVSKIMNTSVITVSPDDSLAQVASLMRSNHVHRVLVTQDSKLVGIISTFDVLGVLEAH